MNRIGTQRRQLLKLPFYTTLAGLVLCVSDWYLPIHWRHKGAYEETLPFQVLSTQAALSLALIIAVGFAVRLRCRRGDCLRSALGLAGWGAVLALLAALTGTAGVWGGVYAVLGLPVRLFRFVSDMMIAVEMPAPGVLLALPGILMPLFFRMFYFDQKPEDDKAP